MTATATAATTSAARAASAGASTRTVTAVPCGRLNGAPITAEYEFEIVREPEPFGVGKSRLWGRCEGSARHGLDRVAPLAIVHTDTIKERP